MSDTAVAMVCDPGFLPYAAYLAHALDRAEPDRGFDLVIVGPDLPPLPAELGRIRVHRFDGDNPFAHRDLSKRRSHASYLCLMLPELLPEYRRILYLDCDIVANGPVGAVLEAGLHGQALGAVRDAQQWRTPGRAPAEFSRLGLPTAPSLNSGVLLFDTGRWRAEGWTGACVEAARDPKLAKGYVRNDQSAINLALRGRWTELSPVWNWQWTETTRYFADDAGARLIHFIGPRKPWRTSTLPPRFTSGYAPFLQRFFPDAPAPPERPPRLDRHRRAFLRHWLRAPAMQAYLDRFPDTLTTLAPAPAP
jgi:hypothetical protein